MRIKFTVSRTVKAPGGATFEAGKTYDLPPASAAHWLNRGVAVVATVKDVPADDDNGGGGDDDALASMTNDDLRKVAEDVGIDLPSGYVKNDDLIKMIRDVKDD